VASHFGQVERREHGLILVIVPVIQTHRLTSVYSLCRNNKGSRSATIGHFLLGHRVLMAGASGRTVVFHSKLLACVPSKPYDPKGNALLSRILTPYCFDTSYRQ